MTYSDGPKVLQAEIVPLSKPMLNQRIRCWEEPRVNDSGLTWPVDIFLGGHHRRQTQHPAPIARLPFRAGRVVERNAPRPPQNNPLEVPVSQIAASHLVNWFPEADAPYLRFLSVSVCDALVRAREHRPAQIGQALRTAGSARREAQVNVNLLIFRTIERTVANPAPPHAD